ncbi:hypothetical protein [Pseudodesulfovibrio sediminis]|uniref:Uncharacterized protein n=1 Tax=Pseudodesulfovibrio sediminis TaxID=2810563 RepID=A0ABM7PAG9_9BACT|nr:hypothetical protein [Pseudodesulfovibrio sediminis]BCS90079.1 hypothetical protein PSDVSF_33210 [Pseudodesulfovibrio sediminis]
MTDDTIIDVQHVTCGLVPLMSTHLGGAEPDVDTVEFKVRQGIQTELWNSFGTGSEWRLTDIRKDLFFDVVTFVRVEQSELDPLGLMEF